MPYYEDVDCEKTQAPIDDYRLKQAVAEMRAKQVSVVDECAGRALNDSEIVAELFRYHAPNGSTIPRYAAINQAAKNFAEVILSNCPRGADRSDAIRKIREARMVANAAVALNGLSL